MTGLIGYTGFVGQNLDDGTYDEYYCSSNIENIVGKHFTKLVCAGVPGNKTLANLYPEKDMASISRLLECLNKVTCDTFVLISTFDVYEKYNGVDEDTQVGLTTTAYGNHRIEVENFVKMKFSKYHIVRLPGIYGKGLKKNFIYDLIYQIPKMMSNWEIDEIKQKANSKQVKLLESCYQYSLNENCYQFAGVTGEIQLHQLQDLMIKTGYTSLRFTGSESKYQYYHLKYLKHDLEKIITLDIPIINMATEPLSATEIASLTLDFPFSNRLDMSKKVSFDIKSKYATKFDSENGYLYRKDTEVKDLKEFFKNYKKYTTIETKGKSNAI